MKRSKIKRDSFKNLKIRKKDFFRIFFSNFFLNNFFHQFSQRDENTFWTFSVEIFVGKIFPSIFLIRLENLRKKMSLQFLFRNYEEKILLQNIKKRIISNHAFFLARIKFLFFKQNPKLETLNIWIILWINLETTKQKIWKTHYLFFLRAFLKIYVVFFLHLDFLTNEKTWKVYLECLILK